MISRALGTALISSCFILEASNASPSVILTKRATLAFVMRPGPSPTGRDAAGRLSLKITGEVISRSAPRENFYFLLSNPIRRAMITFIISFVPAYIDCTAASA